MLISERLWKRSFGGNPSIIGRDVRLDGTPRTIVGVMPAGFRFPSQTDLWVPMASVFRNERQPFLARGSGDRPVEAGRHGATSAGRDDAHRRAPRVAISRYQQRDRRCCDSIARSLRRRCAFLAAPPAGLLRRRASDRVREREPAFAGARHHARTRTLRPGRARRQPLAARAAGPHRKRVARPCRKRGRRRPGFLAGGRRRHVDSHRAAVLDHDRSERERPHFHGRRFLHHRFARRFAARVAGRLALAFLNR